MLKILTRIINLIIHIPAIYAIYYFWQPISNWYLTKIPALGVDLYLSATYASYHLRHFRLPFNSFKDFWFAGSPLMRDTSQLAFYLMVPFVAKLGGPAGAQSFAMFSLVFFVICCYLLFAKLSHNQGFALFLAVLVLLSPSIYGSATWAGSLPYFFSQAAFVLGLFVGAFYLEKAKFRFLAGMMLVTGVGFLVHPLSVLAFLIPASLLIIVFGGLYARLPISRIIGHLFLYNFGWILAGFLTTYDYVFVAIFQRVVPSLMTSTSGVVSNRSGGGSDIANFYRGQISRLFTETNPLIFKILVLGFGLFVVAFFLDKNKRRILALAPFAVIVFYAAAQPAANLADVVNILRHDPYRAFWQFTVAVCALSAALWGYFFSSLVHRLPGKNFFKMATLIVSIVISLGFAGATFYVFRAQIASHIQALEKNSEFTSAFPEALGIKIKKDEQEILGRQLVPSFIDPNDKNKRLYSADQTFNIWWNSFFAMPLARGYIDPPIGTQNRGGFFWLDIAIANDSLVRDFKVSENTALNNALFLIDWYAINYFEGGRLSSKGPSPGPSSYLVKNKIFDLEEQVRTFGGILKWQTASGKPELIPDLPQNLHYFRVDGKYTSPILYPTNASTVAIFSNEAGYEDILRLIASFNIDSKKLIPITAGPLIDNFNLDDFKKFDAVILHEYQYKNKQKVFGNLEKYVEAGGKVFIDTGSEVKDSDSRSLPGLFPFSESTRQKMGRDWEISASKSDVLSNVDVSKFGPLIYNGDDWKLTVADKLKDGANVILSDRGKPILVDRRLGNGRVVWSGINLAYHYNQFKSEDEARLFLNIISQFADLSQKGPVDSQANWFYPEKVSLKSNSAARGVLFKEEGWKGWNVRVNGKNSQYFLAGPTFPGFIYVPVNVKGPLLVEFSYRGIKLYWFAFAVNLISVIVLLDFYALDGKLFGRLIRKSLGLGFFRVRRWWSREEE